LLPTVLGPPPEVPEEIGEAWERAQEAVADGFEIHVLRRPALWPPGALSV
jgi:hypothetical protein